MNKKPTNRDGHAHAQLMTIEAWKRAHGRRFWREPLVHVMTPMDALADVVEGLAARIVVLEQRRASGGRS